MHSLEAKSITKTFKNGTELLNVFSIDEFKIIDTETTAIIGSSGSGKSTLIQILAGLDKPTNGDVILKGEKINELFKKDEINISKLSNSGLNKLRKNLFGFIYQKNFLLKDLSVLDNLLIVRDNKESASELLNEVGLYEKRNRFFNELSGGERQRVSICRALMNNPKFIFADEPTGSLDYKSADKIWELFQKIKNNYNFGLLMVTHDLELANRCENIYQLKEGCLIKKAR